MVWDITAAPAREERISLPCAVIPTWLCIPAPQSLQHIAVNGAGGTGLPNQGSPVLTFLGEAGKVQCMKTLIWPKSQALGRKMSISTSIYKTRRVTT